MKIIIVILFIIFLSWLVSAVYGFSIDEINHSLLDYSIDLQWDKVDYKFSKQEIIKKDQNWGYLNLDRNNLADSINNLNLNNLKDINVIDNSQQGETKEEFINSVIPLNYYENQLSEIQNNIIRKKISFQMDNYEQWVIKVRTNLQRYYNPDLWNILRWWVPSTFWLWKNSIIITHPSDNIWTYSYWDWLNIIKNNDCSKTCNCWEWYNRLGSCKKIPANSTSTWNWFRCNRWYLEDSTHLKCIKSSNDTRTSVSDSNNDWLKYIWVQPIDYSNDPFWITIKTSQSSQQSSSNLWIYNSNYQNSYSNIINNFNTDLYLDLMENSKSTYCVPVTKWVSTNFIQQCSIKNESNIYDIPISTYK